MSCSLRVAIVGCSTLAGAHARELAKLRGVELAAAIDPDLKAARALAATHRIPVVAASVEALSLDELDAAVLVVPTHLHAALAVPLLEHGIHLFVEKPPARSLSDLTVMRTAANAGNARVMIGYQRRHDPRHEVAATRLARGEFGILYYARAQWINSQFNMQQGRHCYQWSTRGASMGSLGSHYLDFCWWLLGEPMPMRAVAWAHRSFCAEIAPDDPGDDLMAGMIWFEGDRLLRIEASRQLQQPHEAGAVIYGERGSYSEQDGFRSVAANGGMITEKITPEGKEDWKIQQERQMKHFVARIRGEPAPGMDLQQAWWLQAMIEALYTSADEDSRVVAIRSSAGTGIV